MIYVLVLMSIFFIGIALLINEKNAPKLLAGFNTLSKQDQQKIDLKNYLRLFRNFHLFLGISFLVFGLLLNKMLSENVSGFFMAFYPILAYIYFLFSSQKYLKNVNRSFNKAGIIVLFFSLFFLLVIFMKGMHESSLTKENGIISISGSYGENIDMDEIDSITLTDSLPNTKIRLNGYALGETRKGWFKTDEGEKIKLILNSKQLPLILIIKNSGEKLYYSARDKSNEEIFEKIRL